MNKPATKEPSMDEILSSIRQIIADDDSGGARKPAAVETAPERLPQAPAAEAAPLALTPEQIVPEDADDAPAFGRDATGDESAADAGAEGDTSADAEGIAEVDLVHADDIGFAAELEADAAEDEPEPAPAAPVPARPVQRPATPVSRAAPLPDPTLSSEIAERLLEPATKAAVRSTFNRLGALAVGTPTLTVEEIMRDMLRPMLKEWLDENLPTVVERMVEKEIARISRGVE